MIIYLFKILVIGIIIAILIFLGASFFGLLIVVALIYLVRWLVGYPVTLTVTEGDVTEKRTYVWTECVKRELIIKEKK